MTETHTHQCQSCGTLTPCEGELAENDDGFPAVVCRSFHLADGEVNRDFRCEACEELDDDSVSVVGLL